MTPITDPRIRFWLKVDCFSHPGECWEWLAGLGTAGYGKFRTGGKGSAHIAAHRFAYQQLVGEIPAGLVLDHLCRNRRCVNPDHLEPVTGRENILRGESPSAHNARKTECPKGHPLDEANTYVHRGKRYCRECVRVRNREWRRARAATHLRSETLYGEAWVA